MVTVEELELLFNLLARAGCNQIEAVWANMVMAKLRAMVAVTQTKPDKANQEQAEDDAWWCHVSIWWVTARR